MANNKSTLGQILEVQREMERQNCFAPPKFPPLPKPAPEELLPDQEEMDKLASKLTEAVLQLRAGDMEGARKTLSDANGLCGVQIRGAFLPPTDHYLDALKYGMGMSKQYMAQQPEGPLRTATEQLMRQQLAERQLRRIMEDADPGVILSNILDDPTDPGV